MVNANASLNGNCLVQLQEKQAGSIDIINLPLSLAKPTQLSRHLTALLTFNKPALNLLHLNPFTLMPTTILMILIVLILTVMMTILRMCEIVGCCMMIYDVV